MAQPEMSPKPAGPKRDLSGRHLSADDIDLPPAPPTAAEARPATVPEADDLPKTARQEPRRFPQLWLAVGLVAALAIGGWLWQYSQTTETVHQNWSYVSAAADASKAQGTNLLVQRDSAGTSRASHVVEVSSADADAATTLAVRTSLLNNDMDGANAALQSAQRIPAAALTQQDSGKATPVLGPNTRLVTAIRDGSSQFFHLRLFDCCDEDGDIVDLSVNGERLARVPLTHEGTVLSIPLTPGTTVLTLRGIRDGGGGITVSFQSSQGDYFSQPMDVGEECQVGVVVK
jgi:hypothetical protein